MARRSNSAPAVRGNMGIRSRLMLLLVVPLAGLLAVTGYAMYNAVQQSRDAAQLSGNAQVSLASYTLIDALQAERKVLAAGQPTDEGLRSAVTTAAADLKSTAAEQGGVLQAMTARALDRVRAADALARTDTGGLVAVDGFSPAINELLDVSRAGFDPHGAIDDRPASTADLLATAEEAGAHERDLVQALALRDDLVADQYGAVSQLAAAQRIQATQAAASADDQLGVRIDRIGDALAAAALGRDQLFFSSPEGVADPAVVEQWMKGADTRVSDLQTMRDDAADLAVSAVDDLGASSRQVLLLAAGALIATLLASAFLVRSAIRSIARPLTELAAQAEEVAMIRLPEAVKSQQAGSGDSHLAAIRATGASEVQEVAGAFNDVQDTALRLAGEQAVLRRNLADALTNLGRRNQALLGRQLDFITSLEQRETDPAFLEHLFKLDHLASRMRRNAESLLILTGSETPRRRRKPAPLSEVVRAAMSEVEDFERVRLGQLGDATMTGPVVIDLVHMLAELIENALRFSPPDTTVEIGGRSLGQGGYQLAVIDHGVGMADVEIVAANQRLAGLDEVDGMPTRYLGQYVIAKLANKTGAMVRLQPTSGGRGVTAVVSLPASATVGVADRSSIARPLPGTRAARDESPDLFAPGAGLTASVAQPDAIVDPAADPFSEPAPTREDLIIDATDSASEDWNWVPDAPAAEVGGDDGPAGDDWFLDAPVSDLAAGIPDTIEELDALDHRAGIDDLARPTEPPVDAVETTATPAWDLPSTPDRAIADDGVDGSEAEQSTVDETWRFEAVVEDVAPGEVAPDGSTVDEIALDAAAVDEIAVDELAVDEFTVDESRADEFRVDESRVDEDAVEDPTPVGSAGGGDPMDGTDVGDRFVADPFGTSGTTWFDTPAGAPTEPSEAAAEHAEAAPAFSAEDFAAEIFAADAFGAGPADAERIGGGTAPPPLPDAVPDQAWAADGISPEPALSEPTAELAPESIPSEWIAPEPVAPEPIAPEPIAPEPSLSGPVAPEPIAPEPITPEPMAPSPALAGEASAGGLGGGLGGGLTRRVPGASLNDSPLGQPPVEPVEDHDRSADGVRSMLSAFQTGRTRGRGSAVLDDPAAAAATTASPSPTTTSSSTVGTGGHTGVDSTPELEEPRDH